MGFFLMTIVAALLPQHEAGTAEVWHDPCAVSTGILGNSTFEPMALGATADVNDSAGGVNARDILNYSALAVGSVCVLCLCITNMNTSWIQKMPKKSKSAAAEICDKNDDDRGLSVEEVRQTFSVVPLLVMLNICFNLGYNAMGSAMPSQACQEDIMLGKSGLQLNGAFFSIMDAMAIVVVTPFFEFLLFPFIVKVKGSPITRSQKLVAGLFIAGLSNLSAAVIEIERRKAPYMCGPHAEFSRCAPGYTDDGLRGTRMRDFNSAWMSLPFGLMGTAEVLVNPTIYAMAYEEAPMKVRSVVQAFQLFANGCLSNAFTSIISQALFPNNLDTGHLEYFYYTNVAGSFLGIFLYWLMLKCTRKPDEKGEETSSSEETTENSNEVSL